MPDGTAEQSQALEKLINDIDDCSPEQTLAKVLQIESALDTGLSVPSRTIGYKHVTRALSHHDICSEDRSELIKLLLQPSATRDVMCQIQAVTTIQRTSSGVWPEALLIINFLIGCIPGRFQAKRDARERIRNEIRSRGKEISEEDENFESLLNLLAQLIQVYHKELTPNVSAILFENALEVVEKASETATVEQVCLLIKTALDVISLPMRIKKRCIEDLCAIYSTTQRLQELTRECFFRLLKDSKINDLQVTETILSAISNPPQERANYTACGAMKITKYIISHQDDTREPAPSFNSIIDALERAELTSRSVCKDCLSLVHVILTTEPFIDQAVHESNWLPVFSIVRKAASPAKASGIQGKALDAENSQKRDQDFEESITEALRLISDALTSLWTIVGLDHKILISRFWHEYRGILIPEATSNFLLTTYGRDQKPAATCLEIPEFNLLIDEFFIHAVGANDVKLAVVMVMLSWLGKEALPTQHLVIHEQVKRMLRAFPSDQSLIVANALADLAMADLQSNCSTEALADEIFELIWPLLCFQDGTAIDQSRDSHRETLLKSTNTVTLSLIKLFDVSRQESWKTVKIFTLLVKIAQSQDLPTVARISAIRFLSRIRCDQDMRTVVIDLPEELPDMISTASTTGSIHSTRSSLSLNFESPDNRQSRRSTSTETPSTASRVLSRPLLHSENIATEGHMSRYDAADEISRKDVGSANVIKIWVSTAGTTDSTSIHIGDWLVAAISILQQLTTPWEIYSFLILHLPAQLSNQNLFRASMPHIGMLRRIILDQLIGAKFYEPPSTVRVRKGDIALHLFHILSMLIGYSENVERREQERIVHAYYAGIGAWERTTQFCIQTLSVCCHVLPNAVIPRLSAILQKMSQVVTQSHLTIDILEFLAGLARLRSLYVNFREEEFRTVFAICVRYLEYSREQRARLLTQADMASAPRNMVTDTNTRSSEKPNSYEDLPQYVFALAYQVITSWFLAVKISNRNDHVGWITKNLSWVDEAGNEIMEEQSQVTLDMMLRTSYLNLGETIPDNPFTEADGPILTKTWVLGLSIVTIETGAHTGLSRVTKRQASGTTYAIYRPQTHELPQHHEPIMEDGYGSDPGIGIFPNHILLQLTSSIAPIPPPMEAICLPEDDIVRRALSVFDRNDTVDGYKVGVIYLGPGQMEESAILANTSGSAAFEVFLSGLGTKVVLKNATFNTQGLDKVDNIDGTHTIAWRDRITEMVFHAPTMMPNDVENDPLFINKKRHVGNDYVNIIWNESGLAFRFDTLKSQFNCVKIVITPDSCYRSTPSAENRAVDDPGYVTVQTLSAKSFPEISPAAITKLLPAKNLPLFARQLALQASVFSNVWMNRDTGEHASSWRNRLREIKRLRDRYANTGISTSSRFPGARSSKQYSQGDPFKGRVTMGGLSEKEEGLAVSLDFSRWAGPNAPLNGGQDKV